MMALMGTRGDDLDEDFYEDDEPVASVVEAFERGQKYETRRPDREFNRYFDPFRRMAGAYLAAPGGGTRGSGSAQVHPC